MHFSADDCRASGFNDTALAARLKAQGVQLADIGSRGGSKPYFAPWRELFCFAGFDADASAADISAGREAGWQSFDLLPDCLWSREEKVKLNITASKVNTSLLKPNERYLKRYDLEKGFQIERVVELQATTLDALSKRRGGNFPEVIKIDTQGAELEIFKGAAKIFESQVEVIISEVLFFELYEGAPLFSELEAHLRASGFSFFGFTETTFRNTRRFDERGGQQRERLFHADGIFFRSFERLKHQRSFDIQILMSVALGFFDHALELADAAPYADAERQALAAAIRMLSAK